MKVEKDKDFSEYWEEIGGLLTIGDTITCEENDEGETVIKFKGYGGTILSEYNVDTMEATHY